MCELLVCVLCLSEFVYNIIIPESLMKHKKECKHIVIEIVFAETFTEYIHCVSFGIRLNLCCGLVPVSKTAKIKYTQIRGETMIVQISVQKTFV